MPQEEDEFELIPVSPLRRLEKRLERMESTGKSNMDTGKFFSELVEIVRMNQELVDELAKANDALRIEISKLPGRLDDLITTLNELVAFIKASATAESMSGATGVAGAGMEPLLKKMDELIDANKKIVESNEAVMGAVDQMNAKFKRPAMQMRPPLRRFPQ
jgi:methyl-accepting chemotaxis protein